MNRRDFNIHLCTLPILSIIPFKKDKESNIDLYPCFINIDNLKYDKLFSSYQCTTCYNKIYQTILKLKFIKNNKLITNIYENRTNKPIDFGFDTLISIKNITIKNNIPQFTCENEIFKLQSIIAKDK